MNKLKSLIILSLMLFVGGQMMGQSHGALYLGFSLPLDKYGEFEDFNKFALTSSNGKDGGAGVGFDVGLKWYFNVGVEGLGVMLSFDGFYNGPNPSLKEKYRYNESEFDGQYKPETFSYRSKPRYINIPAMLGINYIHDFNPNFGIYAEAGAGANASFITEKETRGELDDLIIEVRTQQYDSFFSFAWQVGVGIEVAKSFRIGCSFYDLGRAAVKGEETVRRTNPVEYSIDVEPTHYNTFGELRPIMFLGRIGFSF